MFGDRYFGNRYYGDRYWGEGADTAPFTGVADADHTYRMRRREAYIVPFRLPHNAPQRDPEEGN